MRRIAAVLTGPGLALALLVAPAPGTAAAPDTTRLVHPPRCC